MSTSSAAPNRRGMTATAAERGRRRPTLLFRIIPLLLVTPLLFLFLALLLVTSPFGARRIAGELSRLLGLPVTIGTLRLHDGSLRLQGVSIANPPPLSGTLLTIDSLTLIPSLRSMTGSPWLTLMEAKGVTLNLKQDSTGGWNVGILLKRLRSGPGGRELFIDLLRIRALILRVNDRAIPLRELSFSGIATKGSREASWRVDLAGEERRPVTITGRLRPGSSAAMTLALNAPEVALGDIGRFVTLPSFLDTGRGRVGLLLTATLRGELLEATGRLTIAGASGRLKGRVIPLAGSLELAGAYSRDRDEARIIRGSVDLAALGNFSGTALIRQVTGCREFSATVTSGVVALARLQRLLSSEETTGVTATGRVTVAPLTLAGDGRQGVTACSGTVMLEKGMVMRQGRPLLRELSVRCTLKRRKSGWLVVGRFTSDAGPGGEIRSLSGGVTARLSPRFRPLRIEVAPLSCRLREFGVSGHLLYLPESPDPLLLNLTTGTLPLAAFSQYLAGTGRIEEGSAAVTLVAATERNMAGAHATVTATVDRGTLVLAGDERVTGAGGALTALITVTRERPPEITGRLEGSGIVAAGAAEAELSFHLTPGRFRLEQGRLLLAGSRLTFVRLYGELPTLPGHSSQLLPVRGGIEGVDLTWRDLSLAGVSGTLDGSWRRGAEGRFVGRGDLFAQELSWRSRPVSGFTAHLLGDATAVQGDVSGTVAGGTLAASLRSSFPLADNPVSFRVSSRRVSASGVMTLMGNPLPVTVTEGLLDGEMTGDFTRTKGVKLAFSMAANGLLLRKNGAPLLPGLGVTARGEYAGGRLFLQEGRVTAGEQVTVTITGELKEPLAANRSGTVTVTLPESPLAGVITASTGLLPPALREMTGEGTLSLTGTAVVGEGKSSLTGELQIAKGSISLPSREFIADGLEGSVPLSLNFPLTEGAESPRESGFSRTSYPRNLALGQQSPGAPTLRIGRLRLGRLESGESRFHLRATGSRTELLSLETTLYGGELLGRGGVTWNRAPRYDLELLFHDLSLRRFCETIPAINGYLSGRVDGVAGLHGQGGGIDKTLGFFDLWARAAIDEELLVSKEFLQKLAGRKLPGFFLRDDRPYDHGTVTGFLSQGYVTLTALDIAHTNLFGVRDLGVAVVPTQNRISLEHLVTAIRTAARRGKPARDEGDVPAGALPQTEFKWLE